MDIGHLVVLIKSQHTVIIKPQLYTLLILNFLTLFSTLKILLILYEYMMNIQISCAHRSYTQFPYR